MADASLYEAPRTLEGHGRPSVFLAGEVGQKYEDLDSGLEYVCTGERGFIKVDGDDQSEMYNWELVESGGSTGGGVFTVNFTETGSNATCDKTFEEIKNAYDSGLNVYAYLNGGMPAKYVLNLYAVTDTAYVFSANIVADNMGMSYNFMIDSENNITFGGYKWDITPITES